MLRWINIFGAGIFAVISSTTATSVLASTESPTEIDLTQAISHGDCSTALDLVNRGAGANEARIIFWGGRMLDEGICTAINRAAAAAFFERAVDSL
jgi:hypothetical protein